MAGRILTGYGVGSVVVHDIPVPGLRVFDVLPTSTRMYLDLLCTRYTMDIPNENEYLPVLALASSGWPLEPGCRDRRLRIAAVIVDGRG